jgi:hypothetical protein
MQRENLRNFFSDDVPVYAVYFRSTPGEADVQLGEQEDRNMKPGWVRRFGMRLLASGIAGFVLSYLILTARWNWHNNLLVILLGLVAVASQAAIWTGAVLWIVGAMINRYRVG